MKVYLVKGSVSDSAAYGGAASIGQTEWQFSDGPAGERGSSADYISLLDGLDDHAGCEIDISEADFTPEEAENFCAYRKAA